MSDQHWLTGQGRGGVAVYSSVHAVEVEKIEYTTAI